MMSIAHEASMHRKTETECRRVMEEVPYTRLVDLLKDTVPMGLKEENKWRD